MVTFILGMIWIVSAALYMELGLSTGWATALGLVTALILGPAVDAGINSLKSGDNAKSTGTDDSS